MTLTKILEGSQSTIVRISDDEIELVALEEEPPLLMDTQMMEIIKNNLRYWYCHRQGSKISKKYTIETICMDLAAHLSVEGEAGVETLLQTKRSLVDMLALQESMNELRLEMEHAKVMDDPVKRIKMEALLHRVDEAIELDLRLADKKNMIEESCGVTTCYDDVVKEKRANKIDHDSTNTTNLEREDSYYAPAEDDDVKSSKVEQLNEPTAPNMILDNIRRASVAITGGTLAVAGVACIPCPIVPGCLIAYVGLMILATEFESAKKALEAVKVPLDSLLLAGHDEEEDVSMALPQVSPMK